MKWGTCFACLALCLTGGCTRHADTLLYNYQRTAGEAGWAGNDTLVFPLQRVPTTGVYALHVGVRMRPDFPYQGLTYVVELNLAHPHAEIRDTVHLHVADSSGMRLLGQGHSLVTYETHAFDLHLYRGQHGTFRLYHLMAQSPLPAVTDLGLKLQALD